MAAQAIQQHDNVYLKYQKRLMAEGVATQEQIKRISDNVQAALQARLPASLWQHACLNMAVHTSLHTWPAATIDTQRVGCMFGLRTCPWTGRWQCTKEGINWGLRV